ncbi:MAG TPA: methyltransferase domain-containing protein [Solirubrobacterales bacterium]|nr:methyltransferase domain-containing protein [Solirubrobacterales bacterium]
MTDAELKERARATWSAGDYDAVVDRIWSAGADVVSRAGVNEGDDVLDVACGTGNASIPAAQAGGRVTGLDLTPELFDGARRRAAAAGVELELVEGDAEDLPFDDASFDVVVSTFGCMFAPDHRRAAAEIARVLRPGGRVGIAAWTPDGSVGDFFKSLSALGPPPPPGFEPPVLWGTRDHVKELFADTGVDVRFEDGAVQFRFESVEEGVEEYWDRFGPIVMLRRALEPEGRGEEIREALRGVFERSGGDSDGALEYPGEYLVTLGEKKG